VEANHAQLQQKDGQLQRQDTELRERATQINRQQRELQTLRVREINEDILQCMHNGDLTDILITRRTRDDCKQR